MISIDLINGASYVLNRTAGRAIEDACFLASGFNSMTQMNTYIFRSERRKHARHEVTHSSRGTFHAFLRSLLKPTINH